MTWLLLSALLLQTLRVQHVLEPHAQSSQADEMKRTADGLNEDFLKRQRQETAMSRVLHVRALPAGVTEPELRGALMTGMPNGIIQHVVLLALKFVPAPQIHCS